MSENSADAKRRLFAGPCFLLAAIALAYGAGRAGAMFWLFDLCAHFQLQYGFALAMLAGWFVMRRSWGGLLACLGLLAVVMTPVISRLSTPVVADGSPERAQVRVLLSNVRTSNERYDRLLAVVGERKPDLVALLEVDQSWLDAIRGLEKDYPHRVVEPRRDNFGIALYSRVPFDDAKVVYFQSEVPSVVARVRIDGEALAVIATHPVPPMRSHRFVQRNTQLRAVAERVRSLRDEDAELRVLVVGDLNISPWSPIFAAFVERSELSPVPSEGTWPTRLPGFARLSIDHCLHDASMSLLEHVVGPKMGSDHLPLFVRLALD